MYQLFNVAYLFVLAALFPWIMVRSILTGRYRSGVRDKLLGLRQSPLTGDGPVAWFHGVSVGEIHLLSTVVAAFRKRNPGWRCVVSTTTETGMAEAQKRFTDLPVVFYPFDFSWAVRNTLNHLQPNLIVLAESELWPNFLRTAQQRAIPVVVINGRMSPRSFRRYRKLTSLARPMLFDRITHFAMQTQEYADAMKGLGIPADKISVTGSVKYDGALGDRQNPKTVELRRLLGLQPKDRIWVAGSTHAPEEKMILEAFRRLRVKHPELRLILVPRSPDRFEEVARLIDKNSFSLTRRSQIQSPLSEQNAVILLDSMGELGAAWGLADIGFVGGTLDGKRGGQSMIEPASLGVPVLFGPHVWNFRDAAQRLIENEAAIRIETERGIEKEILHLLSDPLLRERMGQAARKFVQQQQGATERTLQVLSAWTDRKAVSQAA